MSSGAQGDVLPDNVIAHLDGTSIVVGSTIDGDVHPYTMVMNSAVAISDRAIRFALDHRTKTLANVKERPYMSIEVIGDGFICGVRGSVRILKELMDHCPVPSALVQLDVESVKSDLPPGVEVSAPRFKWGPLGSYMEKLEPAMFAELRDTPA